MVKVADGQTTELGMVSPEFLADNVRAAPFSPKGRSKVIRTFTKTRVAAGLLAAVAMAGGAVRAGQPKSRPASAPATKPAEVNIKIGRATTYILGPLNADGTVNYVVALNAEAAKGVTPDNNAAVLLLRALGPEVLDKSTRQRAFKALGIKPLPETGAYVTPIGKHAEPHEPNDPDKARAFRDKLDDARGAARRYPWKTEDHPTIAAWLTSNAEPLAQVATASKRPRYYMPLVSPANPPRMLDTLKPSLVNSAHCLAEALRTRAMLKAGSGDSAGARGDLLTLHRLARCIARGPKVGDRLMAVGLDFRASTADMWMAVSGELPAAELMAYLADLEALPPLPGFPECVDRGERFFRLDFIQVCARQGLRKALLAYTGQEMKGGDSDIRSVFASLAERRVDWNVVLASENRWIDRIVQAMSKKTFAQRRRATDALLAEAKQLRAQTTDRKKLAARIRALEGMAPAEACAERGRMVADFLASVPPLDLPSEMLSPPDHQALQDCAAMFGQLGRLALALAAFKAERGEYPKALKELAPAYVRAIPPDLFIDKPLHYAREGKGYCLYSVGPNMKDDGGKHDPDEGDVVIRAAR